MFPYPDRFMTPDAQRRFYRLSLMCATCILIYTWLFDMNSIGIDIVFKFLSYMLLFVGFFFCFKAFETWSFPNDYAGILPEEEQQQHISIFYPYMFYAEAVITTLLAVFTFVWTNTTNQSTNEGNFTALLCLFVSAGCMLLWRHLASRLEYC